VVDALRNPESGGSPALWSRLAGAFASHTASRIEATACALAEGRRSEARTIAHGIKSGAAMIGARRLARILAEVEAEAEHADAGRLTTLVTGMRQEYARVQESLAAVTEAQHAT
jgi:HPt (histidine-containing phosphotransfer) domain-containing protein